MNIVVCAKTNQDIILLDQIANSGEGEVWTTNWSGMLAKIYHHPTVDRFAKLEVMINHQPDDPNKHLNHYSFAFPQSLIKDNKGNFIGFLMPQIQGGVELIDIYNPKRRKIKKLEVDWHFLHYVALNIASIMAAIHREGYIIGDIKPQNILVNSQALPSFIDTDSFQVKHPHRDLIYPCLVGTDGYTPPELIGKDFHNIEQSIYHDNFRLAVLIYQLLFSYHPFSFGDWQGAGEKPEQNELIKRGIWIESSHNLLSHNQNTIPLKIVHPAIQKLFKKCFNDGHSQPNLRPSAEDWFYGLSQGVNHLQVCDQIDSHVYSSLGNNCYWCARKSKLNADIFALPTGIKSTSKIRVQSSSSTNSNNYQNNSFSNKKNKSNQIFNNSKIEEILQQNGKEITIIGKAISVTNKGLFGNQISRYMILEIKKIEFFDNNQEHKFFNLQEDHQFYIIVNFTKFPLLLDTINNISINLYLKIYGKIQINKGLNTPEIFLENPNQIIVLSDLEIKSLLSLNSNDKLSSHNQLNIKNTRSYTSLQIFSASDTHELLKQVGENITVIGKIYSVKELGILKILNFNSYNEKDKFQSFKVVIYENQLNSSLAQSKSILNADSLISWIGKFVKVSGVLTIYYHPIKGTFHPKIILNDSSQFEIISAKDANNLLYSTSKNNQTNTSFQSQQKSSNLPVSSVKVSTPSQQSSPTKSTYSYTNVKTNSPPFQAQPTPKTTPITPRKQSSPTQNKNFQNSQRNSTSNSNDLLEFLAFLIILIPTISTLFIIIEWGNLGGVIMTFLITSFMSISIISYLNRDLDGFKRSLFLVLLVYFTIVITWFYGIGWGIIGFIVYFSFFRILFS